MANLTETSTWVDPVTGIDNGDPLNSSELTTPETALVKRSKYLRDHGAPSARTVTAWPIPIVGGITNSSTAGAWIFHLDTGAPPAHAAWIQANVSSQFNLIIEVPHMPGITITQIQARVNGSSDLNASHAAWPVQDMPYFDLYEWDVSTGEITSLDSVTDASASQAAYDVEHYLTLTGSWLVASKRLLLVLSGEGGTNSEANAFSLIGIDLNWTAPASV